MMARIGREWVGGWLHYLGVSHFVTRSERHGCVLKRVVCLSSNQAACNVGYAKSTATGQAGRQTKPAAAAAPVDDLRRGKSELSPC